MEQRQSQERKARLAGFLVVLATHAALLYSLWHYRILPPPAEAATLFVSFLQAPPKPKPKPSKPEPPKPKPKPRQVKLEKPKPPEPHQHLVVEAPAAPNDFVLLPPPPPPEPAPVIEAPPAPPPKPVGPLALSGDLSLGCPNRTPPAYPSLSRRLGEAGEVVLRVELDSDGRVDAARVTLSSGYKRLDEAALAAVHAWRCNPPLRDGQPVRAVALQPFKFNLE